MLKELHKMIEAASPAALAREFHKDHDPKWKDDELDRQAQNFLVKKGLRGSKLEVARDKIKQHILDKRELAKSKEVPMLLKKQAGHVPGEKTDTSAPYKRQAG